MNNTKDSDSDSNNFIVDEEEEEEEEEAELTNSTDDYDEDSILSDHGVNLFNCCLFVVDSSFEFYV